MRKGSSTAWSGARIAFAFCSALLLAAAQAAELGDCYDGDTCTLWEPQGRYKVRLHCIDAPEMDQQPWGSMARGALLDRIGRADVQVRVRQQDKYGRWVAELWRGGLNINLDLVRAGYVAADPKHCHDPAYWLAQRQAQDARAGIWRVAGWQQQPWEWRRLKRQK